MALFLVFFLVANPLGIKHVFIAHLVQDVPLKHLRIKFRLKLHGLEAWSEHKGLNKIGNHEIHSHEYPQRDVHVNAATKRQ